MSEKEGKKERLRAKILVYVYTKRVVYNFTTRWWQLSPQKAPQKPSRKFSLWNILRESSFRTLVVIAVLQVQSWEKVILRGCEKFLPGSTGCCLEKHSKTFSQLCTCSFIRKKSSWKSDLSSAFLSLSLYASQIGETPWRTTATSSCPPGRRMRTPCRWQRPPRPRYVCSNSQ